MTQYRSGYCSWSTIEGTFLRVCCSYYMHGTPVTVAAVYPQRTLNGTPTCSSLSGTASYETYAGWIVMEKKKYVLFIGLL